jgi:VanZ family protein
MLLSPSGSTNKARWLLLAAWISAIFLFSTDSFSAAETSSIIVPVLKWLFPSLPPQEVNMVHVMCRKAAHVLEYFVLGILTWRAFRGEGHIGKRLWIQSAVLVLVVALSDEFHQSFVPSRTSSIMDVGYDFIGGIAALLLLSRTRNETRTLYSHSFL